MKKISASLLFLMTITIGLYGQGQQFWSDIATQQMALAPNARIQSSAWNYRALELKYVDMENLLANAPMEFTPEATDPLAISLPMPDGSFANFQIVQTLNMEPALAARYPHLRTYKGFQTDSPSTSIRLGLTLKGFHATILSETGNVYIDPYASGQQKYYVSYYVHENIDIERRKSFQCGVDHSIDASTPINNYFGRRANLNSNNNNTHNNSPLEFRSPEEEDPVELRVYRLAIAANGEYSQFHGGTIEGVLSALVIKVNRLNQVFERDMAVRAVLVDSIEKVIFLDPDTDPYTNESPGAMLNENQQVMGSTFGASNYDFGHVLGVATSGLLGVAALGSMCDNTAKARGASTLNNPVGDPFVIDIIGHEMGHQFSANHSFNACQNINPSTAYEPGGGTTIMSYSGICGTTNNIQINSDDYYHIVSLQEIFTHTRLGTGDDCPEKIQTSNTEPILTIPYEDGFFIPMSTPFELEAEGTDLEGDEVTYCWEQFNLGDSIAPGTSVGGSSPLFRSYPPTTSPKRVFPKLSTILTNDTDKAEQLPGYSRNLTFYCTLRDNNPEAGGTVWDDLSFEVTATAGPFLVLYPNASTDTLTVGDYTEITWDVANTTNDLVNCQRVNILLSTDGGQTFPHMLAEQTKNDGSAFVTVPNLAGAANRIRIEASKNIFFDLSNANFVIAPPTEPGFTVGITPIYTDPYCLPNTLTYEISTSSVLGYDSLLTLDIVGDLPESATYSFTNNPIATAENSILTFDLGSFVEDTFDLQLQIITEGQDTVFRPFTIVSISNDFSGLELINPVNGANDIVLSTTFEWTDIEDANTYDIDIATSPVFDATIVESATGLTTNTYTPSILFDDNNIYYWRVRPENECGPGAWETPNVFRTVNSVCLPETPDDLPINISGTGLPTIESSLFVESSGTISDVNIPFLKGSYQPVNSIRITLTSPEGTEVVLFNQNCGNTLNFELGFDDEAPSEIACPPDDGIVNQPVGLLSDFNGQNTQGLWKMKMQVVTSGFGGGGSLDQWSIEFCASATASNPTLITNETLPVPPAQQNPITKDFLEVTDDDTDPGLLKYTLVTVPANGFLIFLGEPLSVGETFRQNTINANNLFYLHDGSETTADNFSFVVNDGTGGFIPTTTFNIEIDPDAPVSTDDFEVGENVTLFPNPAKDRLTIAFQQPINKDVQVQLFNLNGQQLYGKQFEQVNNTIELNTAWLSAGVYLVNIATERGVATHKLVIR